MSAQQPPTSIAATREGYRPYTGRAACSAKRVLADEAYAQSTTKHASAVSIVSSEDDQLNAGRLTFRGAWGCGCCR